jgi:hypothetical protein
MRMHSCVRMVLYVAFVIGLWTQSNGLATAQEQPNAAAEISVPVEFMIAGIDANAPQTAPKLDEIIDRIIKQEDEEIASIDAFTPIVETYIQNVNHSDILGTVPRSDVYFLGQADFRGRIKVHSMIDGGQKHSWNWSFVPAGFLQMIYIDRGNFDKAHYKFDYVRRDFVGDVRCFVFDVTPRLKAKGARFFGRIWVEDQDMTIVHFSGYYTPSIHFSLTTFTDEYYLHFDSWRTNVKPGLWLPTYIYSQELENLDGFKNPRYKSFTHLWGYKLNSSTRTEELNRLLIESQNPVKDDSGEHDRSPLEAQREWRHVAERNILERLERAALLASPSEVDKVLNTIVNNIAVTNNFDEQIELRCRVLLTTNLEMFTVGNTIILSRGLIDVIPNEETLAAIIAHGMADALQPKPYLDRYAFSDLLRLPATELLKRLSFQETNAETVENSKKAIEFLKKSPYADKLANAGLFLKQLQSQAKQLKQLISPQLGNQIYFEAQLMQSAPALAQNNKAQIAALPLGSRLKIDPWNGSVTFRKSKAVRLFSGRDKMPFEITPLPPYLTRFVKTTEAQAESATVASLFP